jgi:hypothetical protein
VLNSTQELGKTAAGASTNKLLAKLLCHIIEALSKHAEDFRLNNGPALSLIMDTAT